MDENVSLQGEAPAQPAVAPEVEQTQEASPAPDTAPPAETKPVPPLQKRIDQLTWKAHEAERRYNAEIQARAAAEERARQYEQQLTELMRQATVPSMEQYNMDPDAYQKALVAHYEKWTQQQRQAEQQRQQAEQQAYARAQFEQNMQMRVAEARQKYADFEDVVNNPSLPPLAAVNPALLSTILEHEQFPEIAYFLGKNPAEAHRIAGLSPPKAILEVGKIAARLSASPAQPSKAPPPPSQVTGATAPASKSLESTADLSEWLALRRKQIAARR